MQDVDRLRIANRIDSAPCTALMIRDNLNYGPPPKPLSGFYGPRMQINDGRVIPNFMSQALRGENLTVYGDGSQTRSFCYVSDEIDGIVRLAKSSEHDPVNLGNPTEFTILECARKVIAVTGSASKIQFEPLPQDDPKQRRPDISKAKRLLDWEPNVDLENGLKLSLEYFRRAVVEDKAQSA